MGVTCAGAPVVHVTRKRHSLELRETARWDCDFSALSCPGRGSIALKLRQTVVLPSPSAQRQPLQRGPLPCKTFSDWQRVTIRSLRLPYPESGPHGLAFISAALAVDLLRKQCALTQRYRCQLVPTRERKVENTSTSHTACTSLAQFGRVHEGSPTPRLDLDEEMQLSSQGSPATNRTGAHHDLCR